MKLANEGGRPLEELVEPREGAEGNAIEHGMRRTPSRESMSHGLDRVRQAAKDKDVTGCEFQAPQKCLRLISVYAINFMP